MTPERQREIWRTSRANYRALHADERCKRCARPRDLPNVRCSRCIAKQRQRKAYRLEHDTDFHARMIRGAHRSSARCAILGVSLGELARIGQWLEVDRINPYRGYVRGNVQLLAASLNASKGRRHEPDPYQVDALRDMLKQAARRGDPNRWAS